MNIYYEELNAIHYGITPKDKENVKVLFHSNRSLKSKVFLQSDVLVDEDTNEYFKVVQKTVNVIEPLQKSKSKTIKGD